MVDVEVSQNGDVLTIGMEFVSGQRRKVYLFSDVHFDSMYCRRDLYLSHLKRAGEENGLILDGGDFFDAMQGRFDPRRSMDELRPEYRRDNYYDYVVKDAAEFLGDYASQIVMLSPGNHELSVLQNANTFLTDRLVAELRKMGSKVITGGFHGWVRFLWRYARGNDRGTVLLRYSHSGGGGSTPVTRGVIDTNRQAVYLPDAHIVWNGHNHHAWILPIARERLSHKGVKYSDIAWYVRTPGYKAEYEQAVNGFAAQRALGPRPLGCVVLTLEYTGRVMNIKVEPMFEV